VNAYVLDHTALSALGHGHRLLARLVDAAHHEADRHVYAPALCLAAAVAERPALGDHIGSLPAIEVIELGYASARAVGRLVAQGVNWRSAHAVDSGRPTVDWPDGRAVVTREPHVYAGLGVRLISLN
jgi:hypothetical protein